MIQHELDSLSPGRGFSRRAFVGGSVGSGVAAAVLPMTYRATSAGQAGGAQMAGAVDAGLA